MRTKLCAACGLTLALLCAQPVQAAYFWVIANNIPGAGYIGINGHNVAFTTQPGEFQVDETYTVPNKPDGEVHRLGGMFANVTPLAAYIGITNGSGLSLLPASSGGPSEAGIQFSGEMNFNWSRSPDETVTQILMVMQYSVSGYLAPGSSARVSFVGRLPWAASGGGSGDRANLTDVKWFTEPGEFTYNYYQAVLIPHNYNADTFRLNFGANLNIWGEAGAGESWATLDPGAGMFQEENPELPWAPPSANVPEPASLALWGLGALGLAAGGAYRRFRGKKDESLAA